MKVSGHGGYWVKAGPPNQAIHNAEYEAEIEVVIDETTDSGSGGVAEGLPILYKVNSLTMTVVEDDVNYPFALGLTEGARVSLWLKRGALAQHDFVTNTIVQRSRVVNDQTKGRRVTITCCYGSYQRNVAPPA